MSETSRPGSCCFILSGCSGGGKSTLLAELALRGYATVDEAGRQIVREQLAAKGDALPWQDADRFVELIATRTAAQFARHAQATRPVFFDRGLIEVVNHFESSNRALPEQVVRAAGECRFAAKVFMTPPWQEIFESDAERRHGFEDGVAEYESLVPCYERHGYEVRVLAKAPVALRADSVLREVAATLGEDDEAL